MEPREQIREAALKRLARRAYSRADLVERLAGRGFDPPLVEQVAADLERVGLLNDDAYGQDVAERLLARGPASPEFVRDALEARGLEKHRADRIASQAARGIDLVAAAVQLAESKRRGLAGVGLDASRRRIGTALARRGFDPDIIEEALERVGLGPREPEA